MEAVAAPWPKPLKRKKINCVLGGFRSLDDVRRQSAQAKRMPAAEQGFRNLILNQRVDAHMRFLAKAEWDANGGAVDYAALDERECWGGLDLSQSRGLTAFVLVFPDGTGGFDVLPGSFLLE